LSEVLVATEIPSLQLAPASKDLIGAEIELVEVEGREQVLRGLLEEVRPLFDFIILDCPPSLGLLTVNGLVAADGLLIPMQSEYYALEGITDLVHTYERIRGTANPGLRITGVVLTMYDDRTNLSRQVADEIRGHFGELVFDTTVPRNVRLGEAPSFGQPILLYDPKCVGSQAYLRLAREVLGRERAIQEARAAREAPEEMGPAAAEESKPAAAEESKPAAAEESKPAASEAAEAETPVPEPEESRAPVPEAEEPPPPVREEDAPPPPAEAEGEAPSQEPRVEETPETRPAVEEAAAAGEAPTHEGGPAEAPPEIRAASATAGDDGGEPLPSERSCPDHP